MCNHTPILSNNRKSTTKTKTSTTLIFVEEQTKSTLNILLLRTLKSEAMETQKDAVVWAEIPVLNFDRAKDFYSKLLNYQMQDQQMGKHRMGFLPMDPSQGGVGGAIIQGEGYTPSSLGSRVYLNAGEDLKTTLSRVDIAGGKVIQPKTLITEEIGYFAIFEDTEGNHVCLYSKK